MQQLFTLFQTQFILLFGYFIPALSSVKAVVRRDIEAYHQWITYWLILHLYTTFLSPFLHVTFHPLFELLAILWLSLPRYQGAAVVYDRIVVPWVNKYEEKVDVTIDEAHRGVRRWVLGKLKKVVWAVLGEGGSLAEVLIQGVVGSANIFDKSNVKDTPNNSNSIQTSSNAPRHSVKEALSQSSSIDDVNINEDQSFFDDFMSMLVQGLYVFANIEKIAGGDDNQRSSHTGFKLGVFSFDRIGNRFNITPTGRDQQQELSTERLYINDLKCLVASGSQGLLLESSKTPGDLTIRAEIVLSNESDRDVLLNGLRQCLPIIKDKYI